MHPTHMTLIGPFGEEVAARLRAEPPESPGAARTIRSVALADSSAWAPRAAELRQQVAADLRVLLRESATGLEAGGSSRLDLLVIADVSEAGEVLVSLCELLSSVLRAEFAVMFPPDLPPEQRGVGLLVVLATPALDGSRPGQAALRTMGQLERWHLSGPPSPILSRIYFLPAQTERMSLLREDLVRGVYLFVSTAYAAGLRETDALRTRLGPSRAPGRLLATFAVAAADVEVGKVLAAFAWRSALSGLLRLAAQCDASYLAGEAVGTRRDPATGATAGRGDRSQVLADQLTLSVWQSPVPDPRAWSEDRALAAADLWEADSLRVADREVRRQVEAHVGGGTDDGLSQFDLIVRALDLAHQKLTEAAAQPADGWLPPQVTAPVEPIQAPAAPTNTDPQVSAAAPSMGWHMLCSGILLGLVMGIAAAVIAAVVLALAGAAATGSGGTTITSGLPRPDPAVLQWGLAAAVAGAGGWFFAAGWQQRRTRVSRQTAAAQTQAPFSPVVSPGLSAALVLRRRRLARGMLRILQDQGQRLDALRTSIIDAVAQGRDKLRGLGVREGAAPAQDDYSGLMEAETPLHRTLLPCAELPRLWERNRQIRDDRLWACELLKQAWPKGGIGEDLPFGPGEAWERALPEQHRPLHDQGVFSWPDLAEVLREQADHFLGAVPRALKFGVQPQTQDGTPITPSESHEFLIIVPPDGKALVARLLQEHPVAGHILLCGPPQLSRLLVLRTAADFDAASLERALS